MSSENVNYKYLYLDPICVKAGKVDLNEYMYKLILLMTIIIIIHLIITEIFLLLFIEDTLVQ